MAYVAGMLRIAEIPKVEIIEYHLLSSALLGKASFSRSLGAITRHFLGQPYVTLKSALIMFRRSQLRQFAISLNEP
ncbi:hypothetical protein N7367_02740 [Stenotrophomonas sp. GD04145]|uniref:hypothetical protein n=1 Tax=Stenotrophomonas sp. GD04145 TaxID=2975436 RepID=UPI001F52F560|nr:hypothetical protein [Stenotrophomonas sp. GD04145]MCI1089534.1 hypothetical protein [Stenotrophomonas maltophilia]MCI1126336.1 hypothetical protein [Stenotrophomonas maltophilia]MDH0170375.1 hypothetical protein [Stenotrophomonas sp. GD04145]